MIHISAFCKLILSFALLSAFMVPASALEVSVKYTDNRPLFPPTLWVYLNGEILDGDTERLSQAIQPYLSKEIYAGVFTLNSGGGSLVEGMELGHFIADLPFATLAQVGQEDQGDGFCASACVFTYLGADYRYLHGNSQIGVHRFGAPDAELDGSSALAVSQEISGVIISYIREMRADPELYELMSSTDFADILWVPLKDLERLRVVNKDIFSETVDYKNINGGLALYIEQIARNGDSTLFLMCGDNGLVGIANLNKPELDVPISSVTVTIDDVPYEVDNPEVVENSNWRARILFTVPLPAVQELATKGKVGVQALQPIGTFFGFTGEAQDKRIAEVASTCSSAYQSPQSTTQLFYDTDVIGGDLSVSGFKPTTLEECVEICLSIDTCVAISYVSEKKWCWPKGEVAATSKRTGVISAWVR